MVWYFSIMRATFEIITQSAGVILSDFLGIQKKVKQEDYMFVKVLTMAKIDTPSFKQVFMGSNYKVPVIVQVIALKGTLFGITLRSYNPLELKYNGSIFLIPTNPVDVSEPTIKARPNKRKLFSNEDYQKKFMLITLLEMAGFDMILKSLVKHKDSVMPSVGAMALTSKFNARVAPLEHFVSLPDMLRKSRQT